jgi:hypothetical protein
VAENERVIYLEHTFLISQRPGRRWIWVCWEKTTPWKNAEIESKKSRNTWPWVFFGAKTAGWD